MNNQYDIIFDRYKKYVKEHSVYNPKVVKYSTSTSPYFPIVSCSLSDNLPKWKSQKKIEKIENLYLTIDIYAKDVTKGTKKIASQIIVDELINLTYMFFEDGLDMDRTLSKPTPNIDTNILRHTIQYQCAISNRGNITRR